MINKETVYKIKLIALNSNTLHRGDEWAKGTNIYKRGGSGKTWTSKLLVNKSLKEIQEQSSWAYGVDFTAEIVTFELMQVSTSKVEI